MAPTTPTDGVTFDFAGLTNELHAEDAYEREGKTARTLIREEDLRLVLVALKAGGSIAEHSAKATATVHTISGHVQLKLPERVVDVRAGQVLVLGKGLPHDVTAAVDSVFLLTLGWSGKGPKDGSGA